MKYIYTDHNSEAVVFEATASCISEADEKFEAASGIHPAKQKAIGCQIVAEENK